MKHLHEHDHGKIHEAMHLSMELAKIALRAASVAAAFCLVKEVHRVHKAIEKKHKLLP